MRLNLLYRAAAIVTLVALLPIAGSVALHAATGPILLKRGVGIHQWLNWSPLDQSGAYQWPPYQRLEAWGSVDDFQRIRAMGFDFVRLSVDPGPLLAADSKRLAQALALLERDIRIVTGTGLKVIFDLHPVSQVAAWSPASIQASSNGKLGARYQAVVAGAAAMLARVGSDKTALELMNEPQFYPCEGSGGAAWEAMLTNLLRAVRSAAPDLTLVVTGACGGNITGLTQLVPARLADDRLLYSFHFYEPLPFTHQGTGDAKDVTGAPWPVTQASIAQSLEQSVAMAQADESLTPDKRVAALGKIGDYLTSYAAGHWDDQRLKARFDEVRKWAEQQGVPANRLLMGEFGVMAATSDRGGALDVDRFRWLNAVRSEADALGAAWSYWEYSNPHGMSLTSPDAARRPDPIAVRALELSGARSPNAARGTSRVLEAEDSACRCATAFTGFSHFLGLGDGIPPVITVRYSCPQRF